MKLNNLLIKVVVLTVSFALGAALIWLRANNESGKEPKWKDTPENRARVLAEARVNGWVIATTNSDGKKYYFMGSSKYMFPVRAEELDFFMLWRDNQRMTDDMRGKGTQYMGADFGPKTFRTNDGKEVELKLTVDHVAPGTSVEELLQREGK